MKKKVVPDEIYSIFTDYHWPGNIRELEHAILRLIIMAGDAPSLNVNHVSFSEKSFISADSPGSYEQAVHIISEKVVHTGLPLKQVTKDILHTILMAFDNNVKRATKKTNISKDIFYRVKKF